MIFKKIKDFLSSEEKITDPLQKIKSLCRKFEIRKYVINDDFSIDVDGDVFLDNHGLVELPLKFGKVKGDFMIRDNKLISLKGSPTEVLGDFYCQENKLTTLTCSPLIVYGSFDCRYNQLTSLAGAATEVGGGFHCDYNKLTNLQGAPKKINCDIGFATSDFSCRHNPLLVSLNGIGSSLIKGSFYCHKTPVEEIWDLFQKDPQFLDVFESYNLFQIPGVIDAAVIEEIAHHLGQTLPSNWQLKNYRVI